MLSTLSVSSSSVIGVLSHSLLSLLKASTLEKFGLPGLKILRVWVTAQLSSGYIVTIAQDVITKTSILDAP